MKEKGKENEKEKGKERKSDKEQGKLHIEQGKLHIEQYFLQKTFELIKYLRKLLMRKKTDNNLSSKRYHNESTNKKIRLKLDELLLTMEEWLYKKYKVRESNREFDALLLGDLESGVENELINLAKGELISGANINSNLTSEVGTNDQLMVGEKRYDIIKIAHHGSKYSTSDEFLEYYGARFAWISSGYGNRYGHPHKELLERLKENQIPYKCTGNEGAITINTDGMRVWE